MAQPKTQLARTCTCSRLISLLEQYERSGRSVSIDFRKEGRSLTKVSRARHLIHPYPAKLLVDIPRFFLSNDILSTEGDTVLDPFCGTGTVLLEAAYQKRRWIGVDSNPLARLISSVKLSSVDETRLHPLLQNLKSGCQASSIAPAPDVINIDHWYEPRLKVQLAQIASTIAALSDSPEKDFLQVCLSVCCRQLSNADPRLSVPVKMKVDHYPLGHVLRATISKKLAQLDSVDAYDHFTDVSQALLRTICSSPPPISFQRGRFLTDALTIATSLPLDSVDLIITSPPYLGAQKYIRASSLNLGWLGFAAGHQLRALEGRTIGREHFRKSEVSDLAPTGLRHADKLISSVAKENPLRAKIANAYITEMRTALFQMNQVLKPGGHVVLIAGNNHLCGRPFPTERYLRTVAQELGLEIRLRLVDTIKSRGLMTKRNKTADIISREHVLLLRKAISVQEAR